MPFPVSLSRIFMIGLIAAAGVVLNACGDSSHAPLKGGSHPLRMYSPTATPQHRHSMLVDVGGYRLYVSCMGQGSPTVVFEAGLGEDLSTWNQVQPAVAQFTQACVYVLNFTSL